MGQGTQQQPAQPAKTEALPDPWAALPSGVLATRLEGVDSFFAIPGEQARQSWNVGPTYGKHRIESMRMLHDPPGVLVTSGEVAVHGGPKEQGLKDGKRHRVLIPLGYLRSVVLAS